MKWTIPFLAVVCVTLAMPKKERAFSLFSVVTFPNNECTTTESSTIQGICRTGDECGESGGIQSGNCASGFGVCCYHTITVAGGATGAVTNNLTYIQNTGYPATTGTAAATAGQTYTYTVAGGESICQIRLDFVDVELKQPTADGVCTGAAQDQLTASSASTTVLGVTNLCGTLTGQHMYIHNDGADIVSTIAITLGTDTTGRKWKIKVTQIECDSMSRAPPGCLQYYTGSTGTIASFNGASTTNQMIAFQEYSACIRTEAGMCSFAMTQARAETATPDAFDLDGAATTATTALIGSTACNLEFAYIVIPNTAVTSPLYCGTVLAPAPSGAAATPATEASAVISNVKPFTIGVVALGTPTNAEGFTVNYSQIPCA